MSLRLTPRNGFLIGGIVSVLIYATVQSAMLIWALTEFESTGGGDASSLFFMLGTALFMLVIDANRWMRDLLPDEPVLIITLLNIVLYFVFGGLLGTWVRKTTTQEDVRIVALIKGALIGGLVSAALCVAIWGVMYYVWCDASCGESMLLIYILFALIIFAAQGAIFGGLTAFMLFPWRMATEFPARWKQVLIGMMLLASGVSIALSIELERKIQIAAAQEEAANQVRQEQSAMFNTMLKGMPRRGSALEAYVQHCEEFSVEQPEYHDKCYNHLIGGARKGSLRYGEARYSFAAQQVLTLCRRLHKNTCDHWDIAPLLEQDIGTMQSLEEMLEYCASIEESYFRNECNAWIVILESKGSIHTGLEISHARELCTETGGYMLYQTCINALKKIGLE